ncbi:SapC family protein [Dyella acidisoli]|uniref:Peptidase n=1 Tax=Dyella acidisoli TaxID=1867834 RepID=A0ABQ5XMF3_9GAMM|nr:SapC family protein [Dyella acidisoli]GLQ91695.1 peptidase [Dyella acidisoli]
MNITPPFGYRDIKALNRADYVRYSTPTDTPPFIKDTAIVPLSLGEMVPAAWHYPLVFVRDAANERVSLVAMLGLAAGENLFNTQAGWKSETYLPAYVRRYPFCMARVSVNGQADPNLLVCVEKDYVADDAVAGTRQLFDGEGRATQEWQQIELFLREYEADLERTNVFCAELLEFDLLEPLTATVTRPGQDNWQVTGFMGINEKKLMELPEAVVAEWHRNGWLARAWLHLFSLQRLQRLLQERGNAPFPAGNA